MQKVEFFRTTSEYYLPMSAGMNEYNLDRGKIAPAKVVDIMAPDEVDFPSSSPSYAHPQRKIGNPLILFIATCLSTFGVGMYLVMGELTLFQRLERGFLYAVPLMIILVCHEMGHFLQSCRNKVFASWPFFIPIPIPPIGTMGAVIIMEPRMGHRRALFDIGITGPLAGLVPTMICCVIGIYLSKFDNTTSVHTELVPSVHFPLLFTWLFQWLKDWPAGQSPVLHPIAYAGWVGLFITSLNLIPIGQLDGGHILYALVKRYARYISTFFLVAAIVLVAKDKTLWSWAIMLILLLIMGPKHPPTANDDEPLGISRYILGWLTLAFIVIGFTPRPFILN
jgi:membrane-associated protease RseP (regulator of RpoE activity)